MGKPRSNRVLWFQSRTTGRCCAPVPDGSEARQGLDQAIVRGHQALYPNRASSQIVAPPYPGNNGKSFKHSGASFFFSFNCSNILVCIVCNTPGDGPTRARGIAFRTTASRSPVLRAFASFIPSSRREWRILDQHRVD